MNINVRINSIDMYLICTFKMFTLSFITKIIIKDGNSLLASYLHMNQGLISAYRVYLLKFKTGEGRGVGGWGRILSVLIATPENNFIL